MLTTYRPLQLLHMYLFGPTRTLSLGGKQYALVIIDDYSRFTWTFFLAHKDETIVFFTKFYKKAQNEKGFTITSIRTDHGGEFDCKPFELFCEENSFEYNFSASRTAQQNGVVKRKNRSL